MSPEEKYSKDNRPSEGARISTPREYEEVLTELQDKVLERLFPGDTERMEDWKFEVVKDDEEGLSAEKREILRSIVESESEMGDESYVVQYMNGSKTEQEDVIEAVLREILDSGLVGSSDEEDDEDYREVA